VNVSIEIPKCPDAGSKIGGFGPAFFVLARIGFVGRALIEEMVREYWIR
jgi:hypothetical protein